jgi:hypothetical protein
MLIYFMSFPGSSRILIISLEIQLYKKCFGTEFETLKTYIYIKEFILSPIKGRTHVRPGSVVLTRITILYLLVEVNVNALHNVNALAPYECNPYSYIKYK